MSSDAYVPMPLAPGWLLERHLGWSVLEQRPQLKLLKRVRGPFSQFLLLSRGPQEAHELQGLLMKAGFASARSSVVWNDFNEAECASRPLGGRLQRSEGPRWFGVGTFVVDLTLDEAGLLARMASRERGAVRRAGTLGAVGEVATQPSPPLLEEFLDLYRPLAVERHLELPGRHWLEHINAAGDLWLASIRGPERQAWVVNLIYRQGQAAWFLYGARDRSAPGWAGPAVQWATIRALKGAGLRWYDLGQVASRDEHDGIFRFKSALGGTYLSHGHEYRYEAALLRFAKLIQTAAARVAGQRGRGGRT